MKTTYKAKIVFESDQFSDPIYKGDNSTLPELTFVKMVEIINSGNVDFKIVMDYYTIHSEPTIIIKHK